MSTKNADQTQAKLADLNTLFIQLQDKESAQVKGTYGSDLSVLIDKILEKAKELFSSGVLGEGMHAAIHFAIDMLTKASATMPVWQKVLITAFVIPLLESIDKRWHPDTPPV
jgi:hypothetical protein